MRLHRKRKLIKQREMPTICEKSHFSLNNDGSQGRGSYLVSIVIHLEIAKAGRQVPKPSC